MSIEQARRFIERVHLDDDFRTRVLAEPDVERRMRLIRSEGFDCTAEEIAAALVTLSSAVIEGTATDWFTTPEPDLHEDAPWNSFSHPN